MADRLAVFDVPILSSMGGSIADSLCRYIDDLPDSSRDIRGLVKTLYDIKAALRDLDVAFQDPRFNRLTRELLDDIVLGIGSCSRSLRELDNIVSKYTSGRRAASSRRAWHEIQASFLKADGFSLINRLEVHRTFLLQLKGVLQYKSSSRPSSERGTSERGELSRLREKMRYLADNHEKVAKRMREVEEHQRRSAEDKVYMNRYPPSPPYDGPQPRRTPSGFPPTPPMEPQRRTFTPAPVFNTTGFPPTPPMEPIRYMTPHGSIHGSPHGSAHGSRPMSPATPITPISPPLRDSRYVPPAPSPMPSPPKLRGGNLASALAVARPNWWADVFDGSAGHTGFKEAPIKTTEGSQCFGMPMDTLNMAREEIEIIKVEFDNDLTLRLYRDEMTEAAKVVCTIGPQYGAGGYFDRRAPPNKFQTFIDASLLTVSRAGSSLHLKRRGILWACLYFADIENMVLFYHTFLALRFGGPNAPVPKKSEYWLDGEELLFSGEIDDEGHPHLLRVLQDRDSGVIRLASAKVEGDYTDATIWTAFITDYIGAPEWMHCSRTNKIVLRNLRQFSFSVYFDTNTWKNYELRFRNPGDAKAFERVINDIRLPGQGY